MMNEAISDVDDKKPTHKNHWFQKALWAALLSLSLNSVANGSPPRPRGQLVAPLFISNADFRSVLTVRNPAATPILVLVAFYSLRGEEVGKTQLVVDTRAHLDLDVDDVQMAKHEFAEVGSIALSGMPDTGADFAASLKITSRNGDEQVTVEEQCETIEDEPRPFLTASVATSVSVPVLAVHSFDSWPQSIDITCLDAAGRTYESQMTLPPRMTFLVNACISHKGEGRTYWQLLQGDDGGAKGAVDIQIKSGDPAGSIAAWGFASASRQKGSALQIVGIEFGEWSTPMKLGSSDF